MQQSHPIIAPDPVATARRVLATDRERRAQACEAAIKRLLAEYDCQLEALPHQVSPGVWQFVIGVTAE